MSLTDQQWCPTSVQVTVLQARGLRIKGKSGTNDAYAVIQVGKEKYQTSVVEKCVAPVWKEEACFDLPQLNQGGGGSTLHVHVLHRALVGPDKLLGQAVINLSQLSEDKTRNKTEWFKLLDKTGKPDKDRGEVLVDIQFMRNNMTASMFDLSAAGKSRSRLGKFKDKVRGKKKESDSVTSVAPSLSQVLTDSEEEGNGDGEAATGKDGKHKKHKIKSLFSPKSNLQKSMSQSMSVLPGKNSTLSGSQSSGLNVDSSDGKKKFKFMIHKRSGSSDSKDSSSGREKQVSVEQSNLCINGSHIYCEEPPPRTSRISSNFSLASSGHGSMEDVPENSPPPEPQKGARQCSPWEEGEEEEEDTPEIENVKANVSESQRTIIEEDRKEEKVKKQQERLESLAEDREKLEEEETRRKEEEKIRREEETRRREQEERVRMEEERERLAEEKRLQDLERRKMEEEEKKKRDEEERIRIDAEKKRLEEEERVKMEERRQEEQKLAEERRLEEDKRAQEERRRQEEEAKIAEEKRLKEVERRKLEEERRKQRDEEERIRIKEEKKRLEEEERVKMEERRRQEEQKLAEEKRRAQEEERVRKENEEKEEEERRQKEEEERRQKEEEERRQKEEEERRQKEEEERRQKEEEERRQKEEELLRKLEEEREKKRIQLEQQTKQREEEERVRKEEEKKRQEEEERAKKEREEEERKLQEERKLIEAEEKFRQQERIRLEEEEKRRLKEQENQRAEEERLRKEEQKRREDEERARKQREEYERLLEVKMQQEEQRKLEEEEIIRKEEEERVRMEEEMKRRKEEEEERARKEREEIERLEEERRLQEQEKRRIEEEERIRREKKEEEARKLEKLRNAEEQEKRENKTKDEVRAAGKKPKVSSPAGVTSTNPFDENFSCNPFEDIPESPESSTAEEPTVQQRCHSAVSSVGSKTGSVDEKDLISTQREKRPAPQPPVKSQAGKQPHREQDVPARHLAQINKQSKDKDVKTVSVPPQRSVQMIAPLCRSPTDSKNSQSLMQSNNANGTTNAVKHSKRPAPSVPPSVGEKQSSDPKTSSNLGGAETKQVKVVCGLNPFEDDEDGSELTAQDDTALSSNTGSIHWPPAVSQTAENDAASQLKIKSSKTAHAPRPPAKDDISSNTLMNPSTESSHATGDRSATAPDNSALQACDPYYESTSPGHVPVSPLQEFQSLKVQNIVEAGVKKDGAPTPSRRLQPVRPLNPLEQQGASVVQGETENKSTGIPSGLQDKTKVDDSGMKGPYSQLTREELISLVLKQENQLSQRDDKISELEQYIDNLLVRVIEEKPSILMSLTAMKKAA